MVSGGGYDYKLTDDNNELYSKREENNKIFFMFFNLH